MQAVDPTMPVHGPFSTNFKWVTLSGEEGRPIRCTDGQAAGIRALWSFKGKPRNSEQVMQRALFTSQKPIDAFKGKKHRDDRHGVAALVKVLRV